MDVKKMSMVQWFWAQDMPLVQDLRRWIEEGLHLSIYDVVRIEPIDAVGK